MIKAHQIQLTPTYKQRELLVKSCGVARFSYNWALEVWKKQYSRGKKPSAYSLIKLQNSFKKKVFPWMTEVSKTAPQHAIHNLESAFKKMWKEGTGYPKFKKKGVKDNFVAVENKEQFKQQNKKIWIPRIGWLKCTENLRFEGKVNNVVVKRIADKWFAVVNIELAENKPDEVPMASENQAVVGIDLGIKTMLTLSDGVYFENPKALKSNLKSLKRHQRGLSRKEKGSKNSKKQQMLVAKKHYIVSCIRKNSIHQATTAIVEKYDIIVIEDLNVKGMVKNHKLAQSLNDVSFGEIKRQLKYKCDWYGKNLIIADRFYASSKICSNCGHKKESLKLSERVYVCSECNLELDRDLNAAKNLASLGSTPSDGGSQVCGEVTNILRNQNSESKKQKINNLFHISKQNKSC